MKVAYATENHKIMEFKLPKSLKKGPLLPQVESKRLDAQGKCHLRTVRSIAYSDDAKYLATASFDSTVLVYDLNSNSVPSELSGHDNEIKSVSWSPYRPAPSERSNHHYTTTPTVHSRLLATAGRDKCVWIWELYDNEWESIAILQKHSQDVKFTKWREIEDSKLELLSAGHDQTIKCWRYDDVVEDDWFMYQDIQVGIGTVWSLDIHQDMMCAVGENGIAIFKQNQQKWVKINSKDNADDIYYSVDIRSDGLIVVACQDNCLRFFNEALEDRGFLRSVSNEDLNCVKFIADGKFVISSSDVGEMYVSVSE